jgi:transposase-like protein
MPNGSRQPPPNSARTVPAAPAAASVRDQRRPGGVGGRGGCVSGPRRAVRASNAPFSTIEAEVELARGKKIPEACKQIGVTEQTYYRWKKEYGGLRMDQAKRLKELEKENARLKRLLADAELDKAILKEAASGNF